MTQSKDYLKKLIENKPGGEVRPQQENMVNHIEEYLADEAHTLVQAGTGTGKSIGYLVPLAASGKRAIVSTATKQLSEQIVNTDLPGIEQAYEELYGRKLSYALVKGRDNYLCLRKHNDMKELDSSKNPDLISSLAEDDKNASESVKNQDIRNLEGMAKEYAELYEWAAETDTGDRSQAPAVSDKTWAGLSATNAECPGKKICPFGQQCFAEAARERGKKADIVVTNHSLVGIDINSDDDEDMAEGEDEKEPILGVREVLVADEFHELESYLTKSWGAQLSIKELVDAYTTARKNVPVTLHSVRKNIDVFEDAVGDLTEEMLGFDEKENVSFSFKLPLAINRIINIISQAGNSIAAASEIEAQRAGTEDKKTSSAYLLVVKTMNHIVRNADMLLDESENIVKWAEKGKPNEPYSLKAGLVRIGEKLMRELDKRDMTFVGTSATITVAGSFDIPVRNLNLNKDIVSSFGVILKPARKYDVVDVGSPFNFKKQGMMYIPDSTFPVPTGRDRVEHSAAVDDFSIQSVEIAKGHTLILSTTMSGAKRIGERLRDNVNTPILIQGEGTTAQLVEEFKKYEETTLVATMGLWHGLDAPGKTLLNLIIDKVPFKTMDDPLMKARQDDVAAHGGNGFMDVYVAKANIDLAQGIGRLIRHTTDRGIAAILDNRLISKGYGKKMLDSLPDLYRTSNFDQYKKSLNNLISNY